MVLKLSIVIIRLNWLFWERNTLGSIIIPYSAKFSRHLKFVEWPLKAICYEYILWVDCFTGSHMHL